VRKLLLISTALLALTGAARADTFLATSVNVIGAQNVTIGTPVFENVQAGEIQLSGPSGIMTVWCLDVFDGIHLPYDYTISTYNAGDVKPGMATLNSAQLRQIVSLMVLGNSSNSGPFLDAVVQLAIWQTEYGGAFSTIGLDSATQNSVNTALADTASGGIFERFDLTLTVLTDAPINPSQAFGQATVTAVPGPIAGAGLPGLITACAAMWGFARRRRNKTA
jgi:hypothetical protein